MLCNISYLNYLEFLYKYIKYKKGYTRRICYKFLYININLKYLSS